MTPERGLTLCYVQPSSRLHSRRYAIQDLGRTDIHRLGIPHEEKLGGIVWVHVVHYHVWPPSAVIKAVPTDLHRSNSVQLASLLTAWAASQLVYTNWKRLRMLTLTL